MYISLYILCSPDSHCPGKPVYNRCHIFFNYKLFVSTAAAALPFGTLISWRPYFILFLYLLILYNELKNVKMAAGNHNNAVKKEIEGKL